MAVQGVDDFLAILEKSRLVGPSGLEKIRKAVANAADANAVAKFLVQQGVLTRFQAGQLLAGRHMLVVGPYRLLDRIVSSGTGAVYAAQATPTKESLSLKVLPRKMLEKPEVAARFDQVVAKLKSLDHPGLCQFKEVAHEGEQTLLLAAPAEGQGLGGRVAKEGPLSFDAIGSYIRQAAGALAAAHESGVVHGDLTPNHLICDEQDRVKIVDMGTAGLNPAGANTDYAAPETSAKAPATPAGDIYSLGCTLYFLVTGRPPFAEGTAEEKRRKHQEEMPAPVLQVRSDAPPQLMKLCIRMMVKEPDRRIDSCTAVVAAIDEWLAAPPDTGADDDEPPEGAGAESVAAPAGDETDPEVDRALAAAMAAGQFDDGLDEPPPEVTPASEAPSAGDSATGIGSHDADDLLAEAMAASEFDHAIEDDEKVEKKKARLGGFESVEEDDLMGDLKVQEEVEEAPAKLDAGDTAAAEGGLKLFGLDIYRLLGVKEDDDPAAKKKKLITAGAASGIVVVAGVVLLFLYVILPMFGGDGGKRARKLPPRPKPPVARANKKPPAGTTEDQPVEDADGEETSENGDAADEGTTGETDGATGETDGTTGEENGEPPDDAMETDPSGGTGTEPDDTTAEDPAEPVNPLEGLAASIDLPSEEGAAAVVLGPLEMPAEAECTAALIGAEEAGVSDVSFALEKKDTQRPDLEWHVQMVASGGTAATVVGRFFTKDGELAYQWARKMATDATAGALRRLVLKMESGANVHLVAFRPPQPVFPVTADFLRGNMRAQVDPDWVGDGQVLFVEITSLEGKFPKHIFKDGKNSFQAAGGTAIIQFGEEGNRTLALKAESTVTPKVTLELTPLFKVESENKVLPFNVSSANLCGQRLKVALEKRKTALAAAQEREKRARTPSKIVAELEAEVDSIEKSIADLKKNSTVAKALHDTGQIHFRVFYKLGEHEIDLARSKEPSGDDGK